MAISVELRAIFLLVLFGAIVWHRIGLYFEERSQREALRQWLTDNDLLEYEASLHKFGVRTPNKFANLDISKFITYHASWWRVFNSGTHRERLDAAILKMKKQLELQSWLESESLGHLYPQFVSHGFVSKNDITERLDRDTLMSITGEEFWNVVEAVNALISGDRQDKLPKIKSDVSLSVTAPLLAGVKVILWLILLLVKLVFFVTTLIISLCIVCYLGRSLKRAQERYNTYERQPPQPRGLMDLLGAFLSFVGRSNRPQPRDLSSFFSFIFGNFLEPKNCSVSWEWSDPQVVGETMTFFVKFYRRNRMPYTLSESDRIKIEISYNQTLLSYSQERGGSNVMKVTFTVRQAGQYTIAIMAAGQHINGSPFVKAFLPGAIDPAKCTILESVSTLVVQKGIYHPLTVEAKDKFGNVCQITDQEISSYSVEVTRIGCGNKIDPELVILPDALDRKNVLHIKLEEDGCFDAVVSYERTKLENGKLTIISLSEKDAEEVQKNVSKQYWNIWYEAYLLPNEVAVTPSNSQSSTPVLPARTRSQDQQSAANETTSNELSRKRRKVYCYISRRHLTLKEFYMKIFPRRLFTFRIRPRTKLVLCAEDESHEFPVVTVDDGTQEPLSIMCKDRNVLVATFSSFLISGIGGSESFVDKQNYFFRELLAYHGRRSSSQLGLKIKRSDLLESSYQACKSLYSSDWCRKFKITFTGEQGLDWGGVQREWFELLCVALFSHENKFFGRFDKDDPQAMVHPNPRRPAHKKLKYYEFAGRIVGKCLYESAQGLSRRQNVKAHFTRSFLAQLIGLRVHYKYFESDDKDLYRSKIKYIEENDPEDLGVVFAEEEYNEQGQVERIVDLKPGGALIPVTQDNKMEYLVLLAQWKLANSVSREIEAFQKGQPSPALAKRSAMRKNVQRPRNSRTLKYQAVRAKISRHPSRKNHPLGM